jgi:hypothetical protein
MALPGRGPDPPAAAAFHADLHDRPLLPTERSELPLQQSIPGTPPGYTVIYMGLNHIFLLFYWVLITFFYSIIVF